jgi:hypothetical protein
MQGYISDGGRAIRRTIPGYNPGLMAGRKKEALLFFKSKASPNKGITALTP